MSWFKSDITEILFPIKDQKMIDLRESWYANPQSQKNYKEFIPRATEWFQSTKNNDLHGWSALPHADVTMGCTHYLESIVQKYNWSGFQILKNEYAYYTLMGKHGVDPEDLEPHKPLIITVPHWTFCDVRPEWDEVLKICEQRKIDIHIDMAWIITARDIKIDLSHPCIKSMGLSLSKLSLQWSRVGLRFSRQKSMDSITIFNDYYKDTNTVMTSIGNFWMDNFERDYLWNTYGNQHHDLCRTLDVAPTKIIHVAKNKNDSTSLGIGQMLGKSTPHSV